MIYASLARDYDLLVSTNGSSYVTVSGVSNLKITTSTDKEDITTFDTQGLKVNLPTMQEGKIEFELVLAWNDSGSPFTVDAGQKILLDNANELGANSRIYWKYQHKDQTNFTGNLTGRGFVSVDEDGGGGNGDVERVKGTIEYSERPTATGIFANRAAST